MFVIPAGRSPIIVQRVTTVGAGDGAVMSATASGVTLPESGTRKLVILCGYGARTPSSMSCTVGGVAATYLGHTNSGSMGAAAFIANIPTGSSFAVSVTCSGGDTTGEGSLFGIWAADNVEGYSYFVGAAQALTASGSPAAFLYTGAMFGGAVSLGGGVTDWSGAYHPWGNWWYQSADYNPKADGGSFTVTGSGIIAGIALW